MWMLKHKVMIFPKPSLISCFIFYSFAESAHVSISLLAIHHITDICDVFREVGVVYLIRSKCPYTRRFYDVEWL